MRDTLVLSLALAGLIGSVHDPSPITKFVIVKLVIFTISPMAWIVWLIGDVMLAILEYRDRRKQLSDKNSN
jgi:hypothetical protein